MVQHEGLPQPRKDDLLASVRDVAEAMCYDSSAPAFWMVGLLPATCW